MSIAITLPSLLWHDILDALDTAADAEDQRCYTCPSCHRAADPADPFCSAVHRESFERAEQLRRTAQEVLARLSGADPHVFGLAVAG